MSRKILLNEVIYYGDTIIHDLILNIEDLEMSENSNYSYSSRSSYQLI